MSIYLIAQTPRAGEENHCLIVPPHLPISEREVFNRINKAVYQPQGKDYIAVSRRVEQVTSTRQGREILMLVGIDVRQLSVTQCDEIRSKLTHYLSQFEVLVTHTIGWEKKHGTSSLVQRFELANWGQDPLFNRLPQIGLQNQDEENLELLQKNTFSPIHRNADKQEFKWTMNLKAFSFVVGVCAVVIMISLGKCTQFYDENAPTKTIADKIVELLDEQGFSIEKEHIAPAKTELEKLLCDKSLENHHDFSQCDDLPEINDVSELTTKWVKDEASRHLLTTQLNLDEIDSLEARVEIRNQLRHLETILANTVSIKVYLPFFSHEDVMIVKRLKGILTQYFQEDKKLADYLDEDRIHLTHKIKFHSLLMFWNQQQVFSIGHRHEIENELTTLLSNVCGDFIECQIKKLDEYKQAQSIQHFIEVPLEKNQPYIYRELGFYETQNIIQPNLLVKIRNALRILNTKLEHDHPPEYVFLPLFNEEDIAIVSELKAEFELQESPFNLLEGLRNKLKRKPYRFLKQEMRNLIEKVDEVKYNGFRD